MSLLLEALKKAEKAKEEAQRRARAEEASADAAAAPQPSAFDPDMTVLDEGRHVTTRNELPDISAPLEILSDDIRPAPVDKPLPIELSLADEPRPAPEPARAAPRRAAARAADTTAADAAGADRAAAQKVFEAKFKEPNPRLPFYIVMGLLSVFAVGTVIYFWMQLRPPPPLVNANPPR